MFLTLDLNMSTSSAFWALFFAVQLPILQARNTAFGLTKLAAEACMQCTAQRQQKAANTSLLESRKLLQTATLVFPRPIVCRRLSNNINILAKKISGRQRGGGMAPRPLDPPLVVPVRNVHANFYVSTSSGSSVSHLQRLSHSTCQTYDVWLSRF